MAEGAGTSEGYVKSGEGSVLARIGPPQVWARVPTFNEDGSERFGPPYAYRIEERQA
jgi:hypothetical protein